MLTVFYCEDCIYVSFVHWALTYEQKIKDSVDYIKQANLYRKTGGSDCYYGHGRVADPTAQAVVTADTEVRQCYIADGDGVRRIIFPERWLAVTAELWRRYAGTKTAEYMLLRYRQGLDARRICKLLCLTIDEYRRMGGEIRLAGESLAVAAGAMRAKR